MTSRYSNGAIYQLVNSVDEKIYIGSTCKPLHKRFHDHKKKAKANPNRPAYAHLNSIGWQNVRIILIETYSCGTKQELERKEYEHILANRGENLLNCCI